MIEYKGYFAIVERDDDAGIFHGEVINTRDVITFQADNVAQISQAFQDSIYDYLAFCTSRGEQPDQRANV
jgi:predicted HicB family RNase H-like nuclease